MGQCRSTGDRFENVIGNAAVVGDRARTWPVAVYVSLVNEPPESDSVLTASPVAAGGSYVRPEAGSMLPLV